MINEHDLKDWDYDKLRTSATLVTHEKDKASDEYIRDFIDFIEVLSNGRPTQIPAVINPLFWKTIIKARDTNS